MILKIMNIAAMSLLLLSCKVPNANSDKCGKVVASLLQQLDDNYVVLNDVSLSQSGETIHLDYVVLSKYGVFTILTQDSKGEIKGNETEDFWNQIIITKKGFNFLWWKEQKCATNNMIPNPLKPSIHNAQLVEEALKDCGNTPVIPIVVFNDDLTFGRIETEHKVIRCKDLLNVIKEHKNLHNLDIEKARKKFCE